MYKTAHVQIVKTCDLSSIQMWVSATTLGLVFLLISGKYRRLVDFPLFWPMRECRLASEVTTWYGRELERKKPAVKHDFSDSAKRPK